MDEDGSADVVVGKGNMEPLRVSDLSGLPLPLPTATGTALLPAKQS